MGKQWVEVIHFPKAAIGYQHHETGLDAFPHRMSAVTVPQFEEGRKHGDKALSQVLERPGNAVGIHWRRQHPDLGLSELGQQHVHVILQKALAGCLEPAVEFALTRLDVESLGVEYLDFCSRPPHPALERRKN